MLLFIPPLLPIRNTLVTMTTAVLSFLFFARPQELRGRRTGIIFLFLITITLFALLQPFFMSLTGNQSGGATALMKFQDQFIYDAVGETDPRFGIIQEDLNWLASQPIYLLFGTGWNIVMAPSLKPHNLYVAVLVANGMVGLVTILIFIRRQLMQQINSRKTFGKHMSNITKASLLSLFFTGMADNYLSSRLNVPAFFLMLWILVSILATNASEQMVNSSVSDVSDKEEVQVQ
jgi:hypothetical protein